MGARVTIGGLDSAYTVNLPAGLQPDKKIKIAGKGYRDRSGNRGDLYVRIKIVNPNTLSPRLTELYKQMAAAYNEEIKQ